MHSPDPNVVHLIGFGIASGATGCVPPLVVLSDERLHPISLGLNSWRSSTDRLPELNQLTTGGVLLSVIPLAIAMIVLQRHRRGGLTEGAVK